VEYGNDRYSTGEQAQGDKPFLPIIETVIYEGYTRPGQHLFGIRKVESMFNEIVVILR